MSQHFSLQAAPRSEEGTSSVNRLRKSGDVPAVMYGKGFENKNLKVNAKALEAVLHATTSENVLVDLDIEGAGKQLTLIQHVQHNPLSGAAVHIDFHAVRENERISARVPVELVGEPVGVKAGGLLQFQLHRLDILCLPKDLPERVKVDVTALGVGESFHISDLKLPEGVSARANAGVVIAAVIEQEAAPEPVAPVAAAKPAAKKAAKK